MNDEAGPLTAPAHTVYAAPRLVESADGCYFYHSMDIPGHGAVRGEWDLRPAIDKYLGRTDFRGKRVLDVGAASGFLSFHMERAGAEVVSAILGFPRAKTAWHRQIFRDERRWLYTLVARR